jgi:hypothetical protein
MTWIPLTNDERWPNPPYWVVVLDGGIGKVMCKLGIHQRVVFPKRVRCFYCEKDLS